MFYLVEYEKTCDKIPNTFKNYFDYAINYKPKQVSLKLEKDIYERHYNIETQARIENSSDVQLNKKYKLRQNDINIYKLMNGILNDDDNNNEVFSFEYVNFGNYLKCKSVVSKDLKTVNFEIGTNPDYEYEYELIKIEVVETKNKSHINLKRIFLDYHNYYQIEKRNVKNINKDYVSYLLYFSKLFLNKIVEERNQKDVHKYFMDLHNNIALLFFTIPEEVKDKINSDDLKDMVACFILRGFYLEDVNFDYFTLRKLLLDRELYGKYGYKNSCLYVYYPRKEYENLYEKEEQALEVLRNKYQNIERIDNLRKKIIKKVERKINNLYPLEKPVLVYDENSFALKFCDIYSRKYSNFFININYKKISEEIVSLATSKNSLQDFLFLKSKEFMTNKWYDFLKENETDITNIIYRNSDLSANFKNLIEECAVIIENVLNEIINS